MANSPVLECSGPQIMPPNVCYIPGQYSLGHSSDEQEMPAGDTLERDFEP